MSDLDRLITEYYKKRGLKWPTLYDAILWSITELGEACEVVLQFQGGWVRNNPAKEAGLSLREYLERLGEELGDVIMMLQVAGRVAGTDPVASLYKKMDKALDQSTEP